MTMPPPATGPGPAGEPGPTTPLHPSPGRRVTPEVEDLPAPRARGRTVTVTGTVAAGVERGCLVLTAGGVTYLLLGRHDGLVPGADVTVEGTLTPGVLTACQQGTPLQVRTVRPRR